MSDADAYRWGAVSQRSFDSVVIGKSTERDVRRSMGTDPVPVTYTKAGQQLDFYGTFQYSAKNYIPGYALVGDRGDCDVWWFEFDTTMYSCRRDSSITAWTLELTPRDW